MDWWCPSDNYVLSQQLQKNYGKITPEVAIRDICSIEKSGDNHIAYYDLTTMELWVAFAAPHGIGGPVAAYDRQFTYLDAKTLFAEKPPQ